MEQEKRRKLKHTQKNDYKQGYADGYDTGYNYGFDVGFEQGADQFHKPFTGTSIIIPTCNQLELLRQCVESVQKHTSPPYELIIVDNGSSDGTPQYIKSLTGKVRVHTNSANYGFAGGVNQGMRMARGTTLLILNNDMVVTAYWLDNLLRCVWSDPRIGLVGPMTNTNSGKQLLDVQYADMTDMQAFAREHNRRNSAKWVEAERLTGFCLIMRRETFERIGFFDESITLGNYEDDDYGMRARLLGYKLVIAGDTFIYHAGNATLNKFGEPAEIVTPTNKTYYDEKWPHSHRTLVETAVFTSFSPLKAVDLYPSHVAVKGSGDSVYWIEHGARHFVVPQRDMPVTRVSQRDLWSWSKKTADFDMTGKRMSVYVPPAEDGTIAEGVLVHTPDYDVYQFARGRLRRIAGTMALKAWQMDRQPVFPIGWEVRNMYPTGIPVVAPPVFRTDNI